MRKKILTLMHCPICTTPMRCIGFVCDGSNVYKCSLCDKVWKIKEVKEEV